MTIRKAESAGFCFGVNRAVNMVYELLDKNVKVCTLGPIIHNMEMVSELKQKGCRPVDSIDEVAQDETLIIRSHGVPKSVTDELDSRGLDYRDATCPFGKISHQVQIRCPAVFHMVIEVFADDDRKTDVDSIPVEDPGK